MPISGDRTGPINTGNNSVNRAGIARQDAMGVDRVFGISGHLGMKAPCRLATTSNVTLWGLQTIDGILTTDGDRVLVKDQTNQVQNGIWLARASTWTRDLDFDGPNDVVEGTVVYVNCGTLNRGVFFTVNTVGSPCGTTAIIPGETPMLFTATLDAAGFAIAAAGSAVQALSASNSAAGYAVQAESYASSNSTAIAGIQANTSALSALTSAQVAALQAYDSTASGQIASLQATALTSTQIALLPTAATQLLTPTQIMYLATTETQLLTTTQISTWNQTTLDVAQLQMTALTSTQIALLPTAATQLLTPTQVTVLSTVESRLLTTTDMEKTSRAASSWMLTTTQIAALPTTQIPGMTTTLMAQIGPQLYTKLFWAEDTQAEGTANDGGTTNADSRFARNWDTPLVNNIGLTFSGDRSEIRSFTEGAYYVEFQSGVHDADSSIAAVRLAHNGSTEITTIYSVNGYGEDTGAVDFNGYSNLSVSGYFVITADHVSPYMFPFHWVQTGQTGSGGGLGLNSTNYSLINKYADIKIWKLT